MSDQTKQLRALERSLNDRNKTIKELRKEVADLTSKLDLLHQEFCDKGPPKQTPVVSIPVEGEVWHSKEKSLDGSRVAYLIECVEQHSPVIHLDRLRDNRKSTMTLVDFVDSHERAPDDYYPNAGARRELTTTS